MKKHIIGHAEAASVPAKASRSVAELGTNAVAKERLASAHAGTFNKARPSKPAHGSSNADAPTNEGLLYVVLVDPEDWCDLRNMTPKDYPNVVCFRLAPWLNHEDFGDDVGLAHHACFVVPEEPWSNGDGLGGYPPLLVPCCTFLAVSVRGRVPMPDFLPSQIIKGGFDGVLKTIEAMWPNARRVLVSESVEPPAGWLPPSSVPGLR